MTPDEWDASADPPAMLNQLRGVEPVRRLRRWFGRRPPTEVPLDDRKVVLALCALTRLRMATAPPDVAGIARQFVEPAERLEHFDPAVGLAVGGVMSSSGVTLFELLHRNLHPRWNDFLLIDWMLTRGGLSGALAEEEFRNERGNRPLADALRCVFGSPFHPTTLRPEWRTDTVTQLAATIDADRAFDRLPVLADALEEAGCDDPRALAHLRGDGPHYAGCWVLDAVTRPHCPPPPTAP